MACSVKIRQNHRYGWSNKCCSEWAGQTRRDARSRENYVRSFKFISSEISEKSERCKEAVSKRCVLCVHVDTVHVFPLGLSKQPTNGSSGNSGSRALCTKEKGRVFVIKTFLNMEVKTLHAFSFLLASIAKAIDVAGWHVEFTTGRVQLLLSKPLTSKGIFGKVEAGDYQHVDIVFYFIYKYVFKSTGYIGDIELKT